MKSTTHNVLRVCRRPQLSRIVIWLASFDRVDSIGLIGAL
jgi:hypothetical protein